VDHQSSRFLCLGVWCVWGVCGGVCVCVWVWRVCVRARETVGGRTVASERGAAVLRREGSAPRMARAHTHTHTHARAHAHTHTHMHTHAHTRAHMHTRTHAHTQATLTENKPDN
jgi:hypothetical protein